MKSATDINYHPTPNMPSHSFQVFIVPLQDPDPTMTFVSFVSPSEGPVKGNDPRSTAPKQNCRKPFKKNILGISLTTQRSENQLDISWFVKQQKARHAEIWVFVPTVHQSVLSPWLGSYFPVSSILGSLAGALKMRLAKDGSTREKQKFKNTCVCTREYSVISSSTGG